MFGARAAYERWRGMVEPVLEAGPDHPHYEAALRQWRLHLGFLLGVNPDSLPEKNRAAYPPNGGFLALKRELFLFVLRLRDYLSTWRP